MSRSVSISMSPGFGETIDEAVQNLKEAVELYFDNEGAKLEYHEVGNALIGEVFINA